MYIRVVKNSAGQAYYQVVESYWARGKTHQCLIMSLGRVGEDGEKKLDELAAALSKYRDILTVTQIAKEISIDQTFVLGPLLILERLFEGLGIDETEVKISLKFVCLNLETI